MSIHIILAVIYSIYYILWEILHQVVLLIAMESEKKVQLEYIN